MLKSRELKIDKYQQEIQLKELENRECQAIMQKQTATIKKLTEDYQQIKSMHEKYIEQMNGRAGKIQERLFYSEAMLCHRKHSRKLSGDLRHETTGIRRTQENLKIAQIAKDGALNALLNAPEGERGSLM